jgi:hypothetical protein
MGAGGWWRLLCALLWRWLLCWVQSTGQMSACSRVQCGGLVGLAGAALCMQAKSWLYIDMLDVLNVLDVCWACVKGVCVCVSVTCAVGRAAVVQ